MNFKTGALIAVLIVLAGLPFASANWTDLITGKVTSAQTNVTAEVVSNNAPVIYKVVCNEASCSSGINLIEGLTKTVTFNASVFDFDGNIDINLTETFINVTYGNCNGQDRNRNAICTNQTAPALNQQYLNFTCSVTFQYYDCAGTWGVNVTTRDPYNVTVNNTFTVTLNALNAVNIYPLAVDFPPLNVLSGNQSSATNTTVNNTGNTLPSLLNLNSTNLVGNIQNAYTLNASNFTAIATNVTTPILDYVCNVSGGYLTNYSFFEVGNATSGRGAVPRVNVDGGHTGQFVTNRYCIPLVPVLPRQNYTTDVEGKWTLKANF